MRERDRGRESELHGLRVLLSFSLSLCLSFNRSVVAFVFDDKPSLWTGSGLSLCSLARKRLGEPIEDGIGSTRAGFVPEKAVMKLGEFPDDFLQPLTVA